MRRHLNSIDFNFNLDLYSDFFHLEKTEFHKIVLVVEHLAEEDLQTLHASLGSSIDIRSGGLMGGERVGYLESGGQHVHVQVRALGVCEH